MKLPTSLCPLAVLLSNTALADPGNEWLEAKSKVLRVAPEAFDSLPNHLVKHLKLLECLIPQSQKTTVPHNVIAARLDEDATQDIAVLCSRNGKSAVLVFWSADATRQSLATEWSDDLNWLQTGDGRIEYSRAISVANSERIIEKNPDLADKTHQYSDYAGVEDGFMGKASQIYLWNGKSWLSLRGAD